ncbi:hypothetical protein, partial [Pseudotabrizicola sp.]
MTQSLIFAPLIPWPMLWGALGFAVVLLTLAMLRGLSGWGLRAVAAGVVLLALANPALQEEDRS